MIPQNEQGTIVLFSKLAAELGYTFKEIGTACPDAILEKDGQLVRVEFEHRAKTFRAHKHNPADVDLIICWENNWPESPLPVLSLERYITLSRPEPVKTHWQRFIERWLEWRQTWLTRKRICPMCGDELITNCTEEWDDGYLYRWVSRDCPRCRYHKGESYYP